MKSNKIVLSFFALFSLAGCDIFPFFQTKVSKVSVNKTSLELEYDETVKIDASVYPNDASKKELAWTSSDNEVATVNNGYITGVGSGEAIITCTTTDGTKISNTINVSVAPLKKTTIEYTFNSVLKNNFETGYCASTKEDFNILVIPVWLNDSSNYIANSNKEFVRSDIETAFFWHKSRNRMEKR